jgi:isopenicillin N synthase-like dioxygenase
VKKGNEWIDVEVIAGSILVLIGDQIEIATNGNYKSVEHRVLANSESSRMSIGCFYGPSDSDKIGPMPAFVADGRPSVYKDTVFRDYLAHGFGKELDGKSNLGFCLRNR